jgi:hypothetical protein
MRGGTRLTVASFENQVGDMLSDPAQVPAPGIAPHAAQPVSGVEPHDVQDVPKQTGGRYESSLGVPLNSVSAIGMSSYAPIQSIKCEGAHAHSMNTGTGMIQRPMLGGAMLANPLDLRAATAGYSHQFETLGGTSAVGGLMLNVPVDGRASNPACKTTGGKRSKRSTRRGKKSKRSKRSLKRSRKNRK